MTRDSRPGVIGYILKRFPVITQTFILNEILALEAHGLPLHIFALERPHDPRFHEDLAKLKSPITYVPEVSISNATDAARLLWHHHLQAAQRDGLRYRQALAYVLQRANPRLMWRFLQSGYIAHEARQHGVRHFHAHFATRPTTVAYLTSMITGLPYSFTTQGADIHATSSDRRVLAQKMRRAAFVVATTEYNKAFLIRIAAGAAEQIVRVYNGIDLDRFSLCGSPPRTPFTLLCVARFVEKKGHRILLDACARLRERGMDFQCWLIGDGRLRPAIEAQIVQEHLTRHVRLLEACTQAEVCERVRASHVCVLPCVVASDGDSDAIPAAVVEALACGRPVVTTPINGIPEVVRHRHNGLLVPSGDADALAGAIALVMRHPGLYESLRSNARGSVESRFDSRQTAAQLHQLFEASVS